VGNKNFAVGLFVVTALVALIAGTIWLTGKQGSEATVDYSMYFEKNVGGLMLGGPVFYLGVEVGSVTAMTIIPGNPMRVRVDIRVLKTAPIDAGTYASLALQGITGVAIIGLGADPGVHDRLSRTADEANPVIKVRDAGFTALLSQAPKIVEQLDSALIKINQLFGEENQLLVNETLNDISVISGALAEREDSLRDIPVQLGLVLQDLRRTLEQINALAEGIEPGLLSAVTNIDQLANDLSTMSQRMERWTADNDIEMRAFLEDGLGQLPELVSDARATLREIEKLVKELRETPSKLIYKPLDESVTVEQ
jgi:phospholipid/cholesterol/gamma-HCH transport system substrate-binding protein